MKPYRQVDKKEKIRTWAWLLFRLVLVTIMVFFLTVVYIRRDNNEHSLLTKLIVVSTLFLAALVSICLACRRIQKNCNWFYSVAMRWASAILDGTMIAGVLLWLSSAYGFPVSFDEILPYSIGTGFFCFFIECLDSDKRRSGKKILLLIAIALVISAFLGWFITTGFTGYDPFVMRLFYGRPVQRFPIDATESVFCSILRKGQLSPEITLDTFLQDFQEQTVYSETPIFIIDVDRFHKTKTIPESDNHLLLKFFEKDGSERLIDLYSESDTDILVEKNVGTWSRRYIDHDTYASKSLYLHMLQIYEKERFEDAFGDHCLDRAFQLAPDYDYSEKMVWIDLTNPYDDHLNSWQKPWAGENRLDMLADTVEQVRYVFVCEKKNSKNEDGIWCDSITGMIDTSVDPQKQCRLWVYDLLTGNGTILSENANGRFDLTEYMLFYRSAGNP